MWYCNKRVAETRVNRRASKCAGYQEHYSARDLYSVLNPHPPSYNRYVSMVSPHPLPERAPLLLLGPAAGAAEAEPLGSRRPWAVNPRKVRGLGAGVGVDCSHGSTSWISSSSALRLTCRDSSALGRRTGSWRMSMSSSTSSSSSASPYDWDMDSSSSCCRMTRRTWSAEG